MLLPIYQQLVIASEVRKTAVQLRTEAEQQFTDTLRDSAPASTIAESKAIENKLRTWRNANPVNNYIDAATKELGAVAQGLHL